MRQVIEHRVNQREASEQLGIGVRQFKWGRGPPDKHGTAYLDGLSARGRPQARRLRRPASRLRGLTSATSREAGLSAVDGSFCPVHPRSAPSGKDGPSVEQRDGRFDAEPIRHMDP